MTEDVHIRAEQLLLRARVEGLADAEREWLERHLETCAACVARAESLDHAVRALRSTQMEMNPALASTTRLRLRLRARELAERRERYRGLWAACAASWLFGAATAPFAWRGFEWLGERLGLAAGVWQAGFALWWLLPAAALAAYLVWQRSTERSSELPDRN